MSTDKLYDPLRRKEVAATPEEQVRQWFIGVLRDSCGVPAHLMMSEAGLKLGPDAGDGGGQIVFEGTPEELKKANTFTARYL